MRTIVLAVVLVAAAGCAVPTHDVATSGAILSGFSQGVAPYYAPAPVYVRPAPALNTIILPSGRPVTCSTFGTVTSCY